MECPVRCQWALDLWDRDLMEWEEACLWLACLPTEDLLLHLPLRHILRCLCLRRHNINNKQHTVGLISDFSSCKFTDQQMQQRYGNGLMSPGNQQQQNQATMQQHQQNPSPMQQQQVAVLLLSCILSCRMVVSPMEHPVLKCLNPNAIKCLCSLSLHAIHAR